MSTPLAPARRLWHSRRIRCRSSRAAFSVNVSATSARSGRRPILDSPPSSARKNRSVESTIRLPAGAYVLRYRSDGSHSYSDWNSDPPDDPESWGISVFRMGDR